MFDCPTFWSVPYSLVVILERPDILSPLYMFSCVHVTFTYGVLDRVWYFIPDLCLFLALCLSSYTIILIAKKAKKADYFALTFFLMSCGSQCPFANPLVPWP